jgi:hypothetical protein
MDNFFLTRSFVISIHQVDVFSFGIVMWELLTGEEPYANMHYGAIIGTNAESLCNSIFSLSFDSYTHTQFHSLSTRIIVPDRCQR